jgi:hypothetical protein
MIAAQEIRMTFSNATAPKQAKSNHRWFPGWPLHPHRMESRPVRIVTERPLNQGVRRHLFTKPVSPISAGPNINRPQAAAAPAVVQVCPSSCEGLSERGMREQIATSKNSTRGMNQGKHKRY